MPDEITTPVVDPTERQDLPEGDESNSITLEEHKKALEDAIAQYGDRINQEKIIPITKERDSFKTQVEQFKSNAEDAASDRVETEEHISKLESDIERLEGEDDDPNRVSKLRKELRTEREKARQEARAERIANADLKKTLEAERLEHAGEVAEARTAKFEVDISKISEEYVDAAGQPIKAERLKALCEKAGEMKKSGIQALADTLWTKKTEPVLEADSAVSSGGGLSDANFLKQFANYDIPYTTENEERYNRIKNKE